MQREWSTVQADARSKQLELADLQLYLHVGLHSCRSAIHTFLLASAAAAAAVWCDFPCHESSLLLV